MTQFIGYRHSGMKMSFVIMTTEIHQRSALLPGAALLCSWLDNAIMQWEWARACVMIAIIYDHFSRQRTAIYHYRAVARFWASADRQGQTDDSL